MDISFPKSYVVWDLETSGLDPKTCKILEIGAMVVVDGVEKTTHKWMLQNNIVIPEEIIKITGITNEIISAEGKDPKTCLTELIELLKGSNFVNVTHNGSRFDIPFLVEQCEQVLEYSLENKELLSAWLKQRSVDTAVLVKANKLNNPRLWFESFNTFANRILSIKAYGVKYNVGLCCDEMGISKVEVTLHRAGGDVYLTNEIYKKLTTK